jgi:hypothetical protein
MFSSASRAALALAAACVPVLFPSIAAAGPPHGYAVASSAPFASPAGIQTRGFVTCPPHTVPLGGGVSVQSTSTDANINSSFPTATGWVVDVNNAGPATSFVVRASCARQPNRYTVIPITLANPAGAHTTGAPQCPAGTKILGGGGISRSSDLRANVGSTSLGGNGWRFEMNNAGPLDSFLTAYAICGKVKGHTIVIGPTFVGGPGTQTRVSATCPAPTVPIGGGVQSLSTSLAVNVNSSFLATGAWFADVNNASALGNPETVGVICAGT